MNHPLCNLAAAAALLLGTGLAAAPAQLTVRVDQPRHPVAPMLWGIFFEDINLSADGGIYPELVRNRSFEDSTEPEHWTLTNDADARSEITIDSNRPLTPCNRRSLRIKAAGPLSLRNQGYWGMAITKGERYQVRLAARAADGLAGPLTVRLESASGQELAQGEIDGFGEAWKPFELGLTAAASDPQASLRLTHAGKGTLWLDMVSVLPATTWKNHGLRSDLCEMLAALKPSFVRFPGGCWVEGEDMAHMYHWKHTIGDIANRKPLWNIWGYWATHGLGFHEYLQLSEDLGAMPLFCINVGMSHREHIPLDQMGPWIQDALDALEYANGPTNTVWGRLRAQNGHPAPFNLKHLEIGNENGGPAYHERWPLFHAAIRARYPDVQLIANVWGGYPANPAPDLIDEHYYNNPDFFMQQAGLYDGYRRDGPKVFVGEYAVTQDCGQGNLRGALGEAAFMTGLERNSDIVAMACYAPLFVNVNHKRWNPDLINFDSSRAYGLPSYYVQKLFSEHRGDTVLPVTVDSPEAEKEPIGGSIGVGTWATQAEYKEIKVTRGSQTLFASDFAQGIQAWKKLGEGNWKIVDGALRQDSRAENVRAIFGDPQWSDYTLTLKARKLGGAEGFLILFGVQHENAKSWWNIGGWGNQRHAIEMGGLASNEVQGGVETGRWYDIRVELKDRSVRCYLDGKLLHDLKAPTLKALHASATRDQAAGEVILKIVNTSTAPQPADVRLQGARDLVSPATAIVLTGESSTSENSLEHPTRVSPATSNIDVAQPEFKHTFPPSSLTVLRVKAKY